MFALLDADRNGDVSFNELDRLVRDLNADRAIAAGDGAGVSSVIEHPLLDSRALWALLDRDRSGAVSLNEFAEGARAAEPGQEQLK